jgi:hypothetical protein
MTNSNPGGRGGQRRRIQTNKPQGKTSHRTGGGAKPPKKSSGGGSKSMVVIAVSLLAVPATVILSVVGYLLHGHGVI